MSSLPPPGPEQVFCEVSVLEAGFVNVPIEIILAGRTGILQNMPSLSFLIKHPSGKTALFDLGIRKDTENYPPEARQSILALLCEPHVQDVVDSLQKGGIQPADIDYVMLSHLHWDHVGDHRPFTKATFLLGEESKKMCSHEHQDVNLGSTMDDPALEGRVRWLWLPGSEDENTSVPIGPFPKALDFFGDGSLYLIDTPGHCPGSMNAIVRTSADGSWVYFAGDSLHHPDLLYGAPMAHPEGDPSKAIAHHDKPAALETIRFIRSISENPRALVILAHDKDWYEANKDKGVVFPGKIGPL